MFIFIYAYGKIQCIIHRAHRSGPFQSQGSHAYHCSSAATVSLPAQASSRFVCTAAGLEGPTRLLADKQGNITNLNL